MEIEISIAERHDDVADVSRNLLRDCSRLVTRKGPIEVEAINRRRATTGVYRRRVDGGQEDQPSIDLGRIEFADHLAERDRTLIFVAVIASLEDRRRAIAVLDDRYWDARRTPGIFMRRMRDIDEADLLAVAVEINCCARGRHASHSQSWWVAESRMTAPRRGWIRSEAGPAICCRSTSRRALTANRRAFL